MKSKHFVLLLPVVVVCYFMRLYLNLDGREFDLNKYEDIVDGFQLVYTQASLDNQTVGNLIDAKQLFNFKGGKVKNCNGFINGNKGECAGAVRARALVQRNPKGPGNVIEIPYLTGEGSVVGGAQANVLVFQAFDEVVLQYRMYFPEEFEWVKAGKLPGLFGGIHGENTACYGNNDAVKYRCFSTRLMWRQDGYLETYFYIPIHDSQDEFCSRCFTGKIQSFDKPKCKEFPSNHCSFERGEYQIPKNRWLHVKQYIKLNDVGRYNGKYVLTIDDEVITRSHSVLYRLQENIVVRGIFFSTFYGGSHKDYAPTGQSRAYFDGFSLYSNSDTQSYFKTWW